MAVREERLYGSVSLMPSGDDPDFAEHRRAFSLEHYAVYGFIAAVSLASVDDAASRLRLPPEGIQRILDDLAAAGIVSDDPREWELS